LQAHLRLAYLVAAVLLMLILPIGQASVMLGLFAAADLAAAALMLDRSVPQPATVVMVGADDESLGLLRRTVPALRMRRPAAAVEAQARWRQAAEARRQFRAVS
jgi:hypothetical protein